MRWRHPVKPIKELLNKHFGADSPGPLRISRVFGARPSHLFEKASAGADITRYILKMYKICFAQRKAMMARLQIVSIVGMENILFFVYNFIFIFIQFYFQT